MVKSPELSDVSDRTKCSADQEEQEEEEEGAEEEAEARSRADKAKRSVWDVGGGGAWVGVSQRGDEKKKEKASTTEKEECNVSSSGPGQTPPAGE